MIITVTLNAAIDRTLAVPNFRLGRRHRAVEQTTMAGGKGVNVARVLKARGQPVSEAELELFYDKLTYLAKGAGVVVFAGSLPRGVPDNLYAELVQEVK